MQMLLSRLAELFWERWPAWSAKRLSGAGSLLSDGYFLRAWPPVAALGGPVLLLLGLLGAVLTRTAPGGMAAGLYSQSLLFLVLAVAVGALSRHLGLWLLLTYSLTDWLLHLTGSFVGLPRLYGYLLLAVPTILLSSRARATATSLEHLLPASLRGRPLIALCAASGALLWAWSFGLLVRPVWLWAPGGGAVPASATFPVFRGALLFALIAGAVTWGRLALEQGRPQPPVLPEVPPPALLRRLLAPGTWTSALVRGLLSTLLVAGLTPTLVDFLLYAIFMTLFIAAQDALMQVRLPRVLAERIGAALPLHLRLPMALLGAAALAWLLFSLTWRFVPGARLLLVIMALFMTLLHLASTLPAPRAVIQGRGGAR